MKSTSKFKNLYLHLPRFVHETNYIYENYLPTVFYPFEINGIHFKFIIQPAILMDPNRITKHYYPGTFEEKIEMALRKISSRGENNHTVSFSLIQLREELKHTSLTYTEDDIAHALNILSGVQYELINDNSTLCFRPFNSVMSREKDNSIHYFIEFSPIFVNGNEILDLCFKQSNKK